MKFLFLVILLTACSIPYEDGSVNVEFCPDCFNKLVNLINNSEDISCAFYDVDNKFLSLLEKKKANILLNNNTKGIMHNKFCVLNKKTVITGSLNPTYNGFFKNKNNIVIVNSSILASNYLSKFNSLKYGIRTKTIHKINLSGILIENYFCPEDSCEDKVINSLEKENRIYFMLFTITSDNIGSLLKEKNASGIIDPLQRNIKGSEYEKLKPKIYDCKGKLHHKVFFTNNLIITGSYNPTNAGNRINDENILIIHDKKLVKKFKNEFLSLQHCTFFN